MKPLRFSIRTSVGLIVLVMGMLGLGLALATGELYRKISLENHRDALVELTRIKANDLLRNLEDQSRALGLAAQQSSAFHNAFDQRDITLLISMLNNQFHQYFVTANVLKLEKIYVLDEFFTHVAESSEGTKSILPHEIVCAELLSRAKQRHGAQRLQPLSQLCLHHEQAFFAVIIPAGGLRIKGYVLVTTEPTLSLSRAEQALGMPLRIRNMRGKTLYQSDKWPDDDNVDQSLLANYIVHTNLSEPALSMDIISNVDDLNVELAHTRYMVMGGSALVTLLAMALSLYLFQRTTVQPLNALTRQLRRLQKDRVHLGEQVDVRGNTELMELAADFNAMTKELKQLYSSLENLALTDPLTSLPNRNLFHDRLSSLVMLCQRSHIRFAVFMMDLDRFKEVNDTLGHQVGDVLLQQVAARLENSLRKSDTVARLADETVARLGGDEFAAILPTVDSERTAVTVAQKIQSSMERPFLVEGHTLTMGMSIGIVLYPLHGSEGATLVQRADIAMYQAKHNQQGFALYDSKQDHHSLSQLTMVSDLRKAMESGQLTLHYQPKVDMATGELCGAEALIRWHHPDRGFMPPDTFIPIAEQSGFIVPLTAWILNTAIRECAEWHRRGIRIPIAVNLSVRNLHDAKIAEQILQTLQQHQLDSSALIVELTETAVMTDPERALAILTTLENAGVRVSVDDFGTGYSSLANLKRLPVSEIKIDRSFVMDMKEDNNDAVIVRSTIDLAHNMSMKVTAEGVENQETWDLLRAHGCDLAQGYFISRPIPTADFIVWAESSIRRATPAKNTGT